MDRVLVIVAALVYLASCFITLGEAQGVGIGVNYGMQGDNLPTPAQVIGLYKSRNIGKLRLFDPNPDALAALDGSGIQVVLGTLNEDLPRLASDPSFAAQWVNTNVIPHANTIDFRYISAGNEVIPGRFAPNVLPAMQNLDAALTAAGLAIPVSTALFTATLGVSFPPSKGVFSDAARPIMTAIAAFLKLKNAPLLVNVYPYVAYKRNPQNVRLDYALFTARGPVVQDGALSYSNLFDAILDAMYSALEDVGAPEVQIVVGETGWPSAGGETGATVDNARTYNNNVLAHVVQTTGTPKRPGKAIETYLFAMFNEDLKLAGTERNFGLYYPNMTEVYHVDFPAAP